MKRYKLWLAVSLSVAGIVIAFPTMAHAKTKRTADVQVFNNAGRDIEWVAVIHKYSNDYKHSQSWTNLANGATTKKPLTVEYNTGFGTTGVDWWIVTWRYKGDNTIYFTNPASFRPVFDALEKGLIEALNAIGAAAAKEAGASKEGEVVGGAAAQTLGALFLNTESTVGFKKHTLREEDEGPLKATVIEIGDKEVKFKSPSGESTTSDFGKK